MNLSNFQTLLMIVVCCLFTTSLQAAPSSLPTNFSCPDTTTQNSSIHTWKAASGATYYRILTKQRLDGEWETTDQGQNTVYGTSSARLTNLKSGSYKSYLNACDNSSCSTRWVSCTFNVQHVPSPSLYLAGSKAINAYKYLNITPVIQNFKSSITYSAKNLPYWANFNSSTGQISGLPFSAEWGKYSDIELTVTDGTNTLSETFSIEITNNLNFDDDDSIEGIDNDGSGIRDSVSHVIPLIYPNDIKKRNYLYHYAFYLKRFISSEYKRYAWSDFAKLHYAEMSRAEVCLTSNRDKEAIGEIFARTLDSDARIDSYYLTESYLGSAATQTNYSGCTLSGDHVEIRQCYYDTFDIAGYVGGGKTWHYARLGEDVKLTINIKNTSSHGDFTAEWGDAPTPSDNRPTPDPATTVKAGEIRVNSGETKTVVVNNYDFTDGKEFYFHAKDVSSGIVKYEVEVNCSPNARPTQVIN